MKTVILLFSVVLMFSGCGDIYGGYGYESSFIEQEDIIGEVDDKAEEMLRNYPNLNEGLKDNIEELYLLWEEFESSKRNDKDPSEDFYNSEYLFELKSFLSNRESLGISIDDLAQILEQNGMDAIEKTVMLNEKPFSMRVIAYNVDYYVQAITDIADIPNKWVFIQLWDESEFYFATLSDGDIYAVFDFVPIIINGDLNIVLAGEAWTGWPQPSFLWSWRFESGVFWESGLFSDIIGKSDKYEAFDILRFDAALPQKWTLHTDGSFLLIEKKADAEGIENWASDYLSTVCEYDEKNKTFIFTSIDRNGDSESVLRLDWINDRFAISSLFNKQSSR